MDQQQETVMTGKGGFKGFKDDSEISRKPQVWKEMGRREGHWLL